MKDERKIVIQLIFIVVAVVFAVRLFFLQVLDDTYRIEAEKNATRRIIDYPYRGTITDRDGRLMVINQQVFDLMVVMRDMKVPDTAAFCGGFNISVEEFKNIVYKIKHEPGYNRNRPYPFLKQLSLADYSRTTTLIEESDGFYIVDRTIRSYPHTSAANALGYIGEISKTQLETQNEEGYYEQGDLVGISGIEASYEKYLRGRKGVRHIMIDVHGDIKGSYMNGKMDVASEPGENLVCTIDLPLQQYGEMLMKNKVGSVVAIEPKTGEVLAFISAPSYDPNYLTGRYFSKNYDTLQKNPMKPLFNRPLMATYPPGSIFKVAQALVAQQLGLLRPTSTYPCNAEAVGVKCHPHPSPLDLKGSIQWSCNPYYVTVFRNMIYRDRHPNKYKDSEMNFDEWRKHIASFGFGQKLPIDLPNVKAGFLPSNAYYDRIYGDLAWKHSTIRSLDIGQGELLIVPLQMANMAAIVSNKGYYYVPHLIKRIGEGKQARVLKKFADKNFVMVDSGYFPIIIEGMQMVVEHGTAFWAQIKGIPICGKTGTAQNPHGDDHSVFIAFAPKDDPKIAIAVYVENGGFGAETAAPIASLMIEQYLKDTTTTPMSRWMLKQMQEKDLISRMKQIYKK